MSLSVLTRSSTQDLVALATVQARLPGAASIAAADLQALIRGASSAMASYFGWPFARQRYSDTRAGDGRRELKLPPYHCAVPVDPDSITVTIDGEAETDFVVLDKAIGALYRGAAWTHSTDTDDPLNISVIWKGGWVLPDQLKTWAVGAVLAAGGWVKPTSPALSPYLFEVATGGTLAGTEPTWSTVTATGQSINLGGGAVGIARDAEELPALITDLAYVEVFNRHAQSDRLPGLAGQSGPGYSESYFATQTDSDLCKPVRDGLDRLRGAIA